MTLEPIVTKWVAGKALELALDKAKKYLTGTKTVLKSSKEDIEGYLEFQQKGVQRWCEEISFKDLSRTKSTINIYIGLNVFVVPRSVRIEPDENIASKSLAQVLTQSSEHLVLLGQPGAGKTTSMKYICHQLMNEEAFLEDGPSFPVVVRLRDLNLMAQEKTGGIFGDRIIIPAIAKQLGLTFSSNESLDNASDIASSLVLMFLDELKPLLVLDGFDELTSRPVRDNAIQEIRALTQQLTRARVVMTSRTGEFPYQIENASIFEICPLSQSQIEDFARKWLLDRAKSLHFIHEINHSPFADTAIKPLTLAHLCAIYERLGHIPEKPKTVYKKVVNLLIEEWDEQRSVTRQSRYAGFSVDRKFDFLCRLAYEVTSTKKGTVFRLEDLRKIYSRICGDFELLSIESKQVLSELESHTGLFVQAGFQCYEFAHRSLQEYLAAEYIKGLPSLLTDADLVARIPNELAIAVAISTNPSRYLVELVMSRLCVFSLSSDFFTAFVTRLIQEKPEFNTDDDVVLALLVLYTMYLEGALAPGQQMQLFIFDKLATQFESLLDVLARRNKVNTLLDYYGKAETRFMGEETPVVVLKIVKQSDTLNLPDMLYARERFFDRK